MTSDFRQRYNHAMQNYQDAFKQLPPTLESPVADTSSLEYLEMIEQAIKDNTPIESKGSVIY